MTTIYVPTFAAFSRDLLDMRALLETEVVERSEGRLKIGLEIAGKPEHFTTSEGLSAIANNIKRNAKGLPIVVHGYSGPQVYDNDGPIDMRTSRGRDYLEGLIELGKELNAHYVHIHGCGGMIGRDFSDEERREGCKKIGDNMLAALGQGPFTPVIGIEHAPRPSTCDAHEKQDDVIYDVVDSPETCLRIVKDTPLMITFDTAHYAIGRKERPDLIEPAKMLGNHVYFIHAADIEGEWNGVDTLCRDGVVPGEGRIGRDSFRDFFKWLRQNRTDVGVCVEADMLDKDKRTRAVQNVTDWLLG